MIRTQRLNLVPWHEGHRPSFAAMHADAAVMLDLGGPIGRRESDAKFDRYAAAYAKHGFSRWTVGCGLVVPIAEGSIHEVRGWPGRVGDGGSPL